MLEPLSTFEPLYNAAEMKAAEAGYDVDELMARAGRAVADEILGRFPTARTFSAVCGKGANGGDGRIAAELDPASVSIRRVNTMSR
jgi:NAD(P)H-hydrate repair Nnr-like enzyme with NAD(P)H-hydrate epimerase domain